MKSPLIKKIAGVTLAMTVSLSAFAQVQQQAPVLQQNQQQSNQQQAVNTGPVPQVGGPTLPAAPVVPQYVPVDPATGAQIIPHPGSPFQPGVSPQPIPFETAATVVSYFRWCSQVKTTLQTAYAKAMNFALAGMNGAGADALRQGIHRALSNEALVGKAHGMTGVLLTRALVIDDILRSYQNSTDPAGPVTRLNTLAEYALLTLKINATLDRTDPSGQYPYTQYQYYSGQCGQCANNLVSIVDLQRRWVEFAREQLDLLTDRLSDGYWPVGSPKGFLLTAQQVALQVAIEDLATNPIGQKFGCVISGLYDLAVEIGAGLDPAADPMQWVPYTIANLNNLKAGIGHCNYPSRPLPNVPVGPMGPSPWGMQPNPAID